jgi:hypothetical protein
VETGATVSGTLEYQQKMLEALETVVDHLERSLDPVLIMLPPNATASHGPHVTSSTAAGPKPTPRMVSEIIDEHNARLSAVAARVETMRGRLNL